MKKFLSIIGSISFLVLGGYILFLIFSGFYSRLLSPKFLLLTGGSGALLILFGVITLFRRFEVKFSAILAMIVFIIICLIAPAVKSHAVQKARPGKFEWKGIHSGQFRRAIYDTL